MNREQAMKLAEEVLCAAYNAVRDTGLYPNGSDLPGVSIDDIVDAHVAKAGQQMASNSRKFFAYDDNVGFDLFDTSDEAKQAAQTSIDEYRHDAGDGWTDEVKNVCWGVVLGATRQIDLDPIDYDGSYGVADGERCVDYVLVDAHVVHSDMHLTADWPHPDGFAGGLTERQK